MGHTYIEQLLVSLKFKLNILCFIWTSCRRGVCLCVGIQSSPTLDPKDCSPSGSSVHGLFQARILEQLLFSTPGDLPDPGIKLRSPTLQVDSLPSEPPRKPESH